MNEVPSCFLFLRQINSPPAMPDVPILAVPETRREITLEERIENFVESFLHPYIAGYITEETDQIDRPSMMDLLCEKLDIDDFELRIGVEKWALKAYFEKAALGLYINLRRESDLNPGTLDLLPLLLALKLSLIKDFPNKCFTDEEILIEIDEAIVTVNRKREEALKQARDYKLGTFGTPKQVVQYHLEKKELLNPQLNPADNSDSSIVPKQGVLHPLQMMELREVDLNQ